MRPETILVHHWITDVRSHSNSSWHRLCKTFPTTIPLENNKNTSIGSKTSTVIPKRHHSLWLDVQYDTCEIPLGIYSDSSLAANLTDRHSYTDLVIKPFRHTTIWRLKKQKTVSDSTTFAEYIALAFASKQSTWVPRGLALLNIDTTPRIHCDNQAAIKLTENAGVSDQTKDSDVKYHLIRDLRDNGDIRIVSVGTKNNLAD